jgi:hypothetical protein
MAWKNHDAAWWISSMVPTNKTSASTFFQSGHSDGLTSPSL